MAMHDCCEMYSLSHPSHTCRTSRRSVAGMAGSDPRRALGATGERLARTHLEARGLTVLDTNFRTRHGELDIVAADRAASSSARSRPGSHGPHGCPRELGPFAAIGPRKQRRLRLLAREWLARARRRRAVALRAALRRRRRRARPARAAASHRPLGGGVLTRMRPMARGKLAVRGSSLAAAMAHSGQCPRRPQLLPHRDRVARRLVHLGRGRALAGQQHQRAPATATAPTGRPTTARSPPARTTRRGSTA